MFSKFTIEKPVELTIGLPIRNEEENIERVIQQLRAQTFSNYILLISDNASTDKTGEICRRYSEKDDRITYVRQPTNMGSLFNFNFVLDEATTPYFMWAGGHDGWEPCFCEKLISELGRDQKLILAYPKTKEILKNGELGRIFDDDHTTVSIEKPAKRFLFILKEVSACNILHGIWKTPVLKKYSLREVIGPDKIMLTQAALEGTYKQIDQVMFYRGKKTKENLRKKWGRRIAQMTGNPYRELNNYDIFSMKIMFFRTLWDTLLHKGTPFGVIEEFILFIKTYFIFSWQFFLKKKYHQLTKLK